MGSTVLWQVLCAFPGEQTPADYPCAGWADLWRALKSFFSASRFCGMALEGQRETELSWNYLMEISIIGTKYIKAQNLLSVRWTEVLLVQSQLLCLYLPCLHIIGDVKVTRTSSISYIVASISFLTQSGDPWVFIVLWNNTKEWRNSDVFTKFAWELTPLFLLPGIQWQWVMALSAML